MRAHSLLFPQFVLDDFLRDAEGVFTPHSHVSENENGYFIEIDLPGLKKEDLKISQENRTLLIEGDRKGRGKFRKAFSIPDDVEATQIAARLENGVLELGLPKREQAKAKVIEIQEGTQSEGIFQRLLGKGA